MSSQQISYTDMKSVEDPRAKRGGHRLFDHSFLPDTVILRVRSDNFIVSASYLALHSPVFHKLFYGRKSKLGARFELDHDPRTFGDILDMIYPCYKKTSCCGDCSSSLEDRLNLAIELKMRFVVIRLIKENLNKEFMIRVLQENNAWKNYSSFFGAKNPVEELPKKRDMSDSMDPLSITRNFPDSTLIDVRGVNVLVSASTLSLHSSLLSHMLFKDGKLAKGVKIDMDVTSFNQFVQAITGQIPAECTCSFLDNLIFLGAVQFYEYYLSEIKRKIIIRSEESPQCAMQLLEHYCNQKSFNSVNNIARYLSRINLETALSNSSLCSSEKESVLTYFDAYKHDNAGMQVFVKDTKGRTLTIKCNVSTTVPEFKYLVEEKTGIPMDEMVLIFSGRQLEGDLTLKEYKVENECPVHLILKLRGFHPGGIKSSKERGKECRGICIVWVKRTTYLDCPIHEYAYFFNSRKDLYNVFLSNKRFGPLATFQMLNTIKWDGGVLSMIQLSNGFGFDIDICCEKYPRNCDRPVTSYQYKIKWSEGDGEWIKTRSLNEPSLIGSENENTFPIPDQLFANLKAILRNHQVKVIFIDKIPFNGAFFKTLHQLLVGHRVDRLTLNKLGVQKLDLQSSSSLHGLMNERVFEDLAISNVKELYTNTASFCCALKMCRYTNLESSSIVVEANWLTNLLREYIDSVTEEAECNSNWLIVIEGELTDGLIDNEIAGKLDTASINIRQRGHLNMVAIRFS
ncbi:hypothetical protein PRIPAC_73613 [Pristionchus pacificus]|uniref:BTB domain-containing protein n=1 Tax=Pristionchus pacificus TaxID=54126 RepID=A0A2A6CGN1_PRIPA|nr:hypothetical protein PRIPAC_73613 [Pristionchus pacificus]|eukprot:PDM77248.1 BTB domain-containing protein [Pristionchus pacificus]